MINYNTTNKSFLKVSEQLRNSGVENFNFMLRLDDCRLLGVDATDPNLDTKTRKRIEIECSNNIWYYFRECLQIKNPDGILERFKLTKLTATMIYLVEHSRHQYVIGHRVSFKTHTAYSLIDYCNLYKRRKLWHYENAEYNKNLYEQFKNEYSDPKDSESPLLLFESVINDDDSGEHSKVRYLTKKWNDNYFDIPVDELDDFYYVYYPYTQLVENPAAFYRYYEIIFNHDYNFIRREILCERK